MLSKNLIANKYYRDGAEITPEEYANAVAEIRTKATWVDKICSCTAVIEDVPGEWQEEIAARVSARQSQANDDAELSADEALAIIMGGETA